MKQAKSIKRLIVLIFLTMLMFPIHVGCGGAGLMMACGTPPDENGLIERKVQVQEIKNHP